MAQPLYSPSVAASERQQLSQKVDLKGILNEHSARHHTKK
jgi:hypothetical protein